MAEINGPIKQKSKSETVLKKRNSPPFFSRQGSFFFQPKLTIGSPHDAYEQEADSVANQVMRMPEATGNSAFFTPKPPAITSVVQTKCAACAEEEKIQRQEDEDTSVSPEPSGSAIDWFEMSRPFLNRGASSMIYSPNYYSSVLQPWLYNYQFFNRLGLGNDLSGSASNFFTPFAIDSALQRDFPTQWELMDRELGTSSLMINPTLFNFDLHNIRGSFTMPFPFRNIFGLSENPYDVNRTIQRKCAHCEEEEKNKIQRKEIGSQEQHSTSENLINQTLTLSGQALDQNTQSFMESRMQHDFSDVKIHTGTIAAKSAQAINALAYTTGNNIVFNENQYAPETRQGKRLLAHELTHVVQQHQAGNVAQPKSSTIQRTEGTSRIEDTVTSQSQDPTTGIWAGQVDRRTYVPASGTTPQRTLGTLRGVRISFNPATCTITLPSKLKFEHPNATNWPSCSADSGNPIPATQLDAATFNSMKERYIRLTNQWLNGWYKVRISNCENNCAGQDMTIRVNVEEDAAHADTTVVLANTTGRSCASPSQVTIHTRGPRGGGITDDRLIHESGHSVIGYWDEYPVSEGNSDEESVRRDDFSMAGSHSSFQDWMLLHERHFSFVPRFLETIFPGCHAELVQVARPEVNFEFSGLIGGTNYQGGGYHFGLGLNLELPLDRIRDWRLFIGAHTHLLLPLSEPDRTAFLVGGRLGFQHTFGTSSGGFQWGGFGELGYGSFGSETPGSSDTQRYGAPYYMLGGNLGYGLAPGAGLIPFFNLEGGIGSTLLNAEDRASFGNNEWFYVGLRGGFQWH